MPQDTGQEKTESGLSDKEDGKKQAEKMLNRLKDKPGMGMMQNYQKRAVEKDW